LRQTPQCSKGKRGRERRRRSSSRRRRRRRRRRILSSALPDRSLPRDNPAVLFVYHLSGILQLNPWNISK
jgi:hypothetical protein